MATTSGAGNSHGNDNNHPGSGRYDSNYKIPHPRGQYLLAQVPEGVRNDNHRHNHDKSYGYGHNHDYGNSYGDTDASPRPA